MRIRASNLIKGSFISDAASMPLHWIYNQNDILAKVGSGDSNFYPELSCPFYKYLPGNFSPYGDEALPILRSVSKHHQFLTEEAAAEAYAFYKAYPEMGDKGYEGRLNHVPKDFIANRDEGKPWTECAVVDSQANGISKIAILVSRYAGSVELVTKIATLVHLFQDSKLSVSSSILLGKLLEHIVLTGEKPKDALHNLKLESSYENNLIQFITSDQKIQESMSFMDQLSNELKEDSNRLNRLKASFFTQILYHGSIQQAIEHGKFSIEDQQLLSNVVSTMDVHKEHDLNPINVAKTFGLSCILPGKFV